MKSKRIEMLRTHFFLILILSLISFLCTSTAKKSLISRQCNLFSDEAEQDDGDVKENKGKYVATAGRIKTISKNKNGKKTRNAVDEAREEASIAAEVAYEIAEIAIEVAHEVSIAKRAAARLIGHNRSPACDSISQTAMETYQKVRDQVGAALKAARKSSEAVREAMRQGRNESVDDVIRVSELSHQTALALRKAAEATITISEMAIKAVKKAFPGGKKTASNDQILREEGIMTSSTTTALKTKNSIRTKAKVKKETEEEEEEEEEKKKKEKKKKKKKKTKKKKKKEEYEDEEDEEDPPTSDSDSFETKHNKGLHWWL